MADQSANAKNIDLVTLPNRDTVQLTIYNSEDITLAKEIRSVTLKRGNNRLQFSWTGTLIDPTSVEFRPLEHADQIEVADTIFSGQKPQHLIWNIESKYEGQALVEVTYFTSGLTWQMDYVATSDVNETQMKFRGHVRVFNNSGEEYENAEIRLIVGKINLVEKIAELAQRQGIAPPEPHTSRYDDLRFKSARDAFDLAKKLAEESDEAGGKAKKVVTEGLSEYFMFSVEGTETIPNGWSKRMPAVYADEVRFDIVYRMRAYQYGPRPVRFFLWNNDDEHMLGESPLPDGTIRLFRDNGRDGLSYLGQQALLYVPIKAEIEVNLGPDDLVVYQQRKAKTTRSNFQFNNNNVIGWDEQQGWIHTMRNYRNKPIKFELRLQWAGDVDITPESETTAFDFRTIESKPNVPSREQIAYEFSSTVHHGTNAKQNRVKLTPAQ
jgi:hypothetical protein